MHNLWDFWFCFFPPGYVALWDSKTPHRPASERVSWCLETSLPSRLPPCDESLSLTLCLSFYLLYFVLPPFEENGLSFWVPGVFCQRSEVVLWNFLSIQWSFDEFVGEKVVSLSYSSAILGPPPKSIISKEGWVTKNQCFQTVVLEKTLESPLDSKEIKPFNPKGNQLWIFIGRIDAEAPILWSPDAKSRLIEKVPDVGKDWGQEKKETTEDEMVRWHHWLNGHESERTLGDGEGQESLVCCSPWGHKEADMRKRLNKNNNNNY